MYTHSKSTQLPSPALTPHGQNLRHLAGDAQDTSASLQHSQPLFIHELVVEQRSARRQQAADPSGNGQTLATVLEDQTGNSNVLDENEGRLAVGAKRKAAAHIVGKANEVGARLEQVREEREALCRLRVEQLEQLRHLDNGRGADDANAQALGNGQLDAFGCAEVHVVDERLVACGAEERDANVGNGLRQVLRQGLEGGLEGLHGCGASSGRRVFAVYMTMCEGEGRRKFRAGVGGKDTFPIRSVKRVQQACLGKGIR